MNDDAASGQFDANARDITLANALTPATEQTQLGGECPAISNADEEKLFPGT